MGMIGIPLPMMPVLRLVSTLPVGLATLPLGLCSVLSMRRILRVRRLFGLAGVPLSSRRLTIMGTSGGRRTTRSGVHCPG